MNVDHFFPKFGARFSTNARTASVWSPCSDAQASAIDSPAPAAGARLGPGAGAQTGDHGQRPHAEATRRISSSTSRNRSLPNHS